MIPSVDTETLRCMRRLNEVNRWAVIPTLRDQSVAEHSLNVLYIFLWLCDKFKHHIDMCDMRTVLEHDADEAINGDMPSTSKKRKCAADEPNMDRVLLKCADYLDSVLFMLEEESMGNKRAIPVLNDALGRAKEWVAQACVLQSERPHAESVSALFLMHEFYTVFDVMHHPSLDKANAENS